MNWRCAVAESSGASEFAPEVARRNGPALKLPCVDLFECDGRQLILDKMTAELVTKRLWENKASCVEKTM